ncbi:MAG: peptidoglycan DD-metalloendopeptidase family protein [Ekhidna sp.]|nr:peptidoglycan DD-metalloendopeptidase family protein [Ekhidna sp.]MBC6427497.1 peptidoglycan DD-metalloendopeptidase family protein [Ekhidna sp.]
MRNIKIWFIFIITTVAAVSFGYNSYDLSFLYKDEDVEIEIDEVILPTLYYNIPIDSLELAEGQVRRNQNLSEILTEFNVSHQDLHLLSQRSKDVYDVRKLKAGSRYSVIHKNDTLKTATHFIFEPSLAEYVIYHLEDSIYAELISKEVEIRERQIAAEIASSLYNAVLDQGASPLLVNQLVDVFAWQVDFFRIAKGDRFKIIFEEELADGQVIGIKNIKGAYFEHWNKNYYAIPFNTGEKVDYFDEDGNSLRKTFLKAPLNFTRISSGYSLRRFHPVQKRYKAHLGTDYAAPTGTPIRTVGDGVVLEAGYHRGNGNYVKIKHNSNYTTQYLHMSKIASRIRPGVRVKQGQTIGFVGSTGLANGPHLCFRFWKNGRQVDALKVDLPSSEGITEDKMKRFRLISSEIKARLDTLNFQQEEKFLAKILK